MGPLHRHELHRVVDTQGLLVDDRVMLGVRTPPRTLHHVGQHASAVPSTRNHTSVADRITFFVNVAVNRCTSAASPVSIPASYAAWTNSRLIAA